MATEPKVKRAVVFFDGQNLFCTARECFGYTFPNYDPHALAAHVCNSMGWKLVEVRFYTGLPERKADPRRAFWENKLAHVGRKGAFIYSRDTRHNQEKGIDIRIALDVVGKALRQDLDVAVIFSQDADFSEVADEVRWIAASQRRWIKMACAYPDAGAARKKGQYSRGIPGTDWIRRSKAEYDACIDPLDHRPKNPPRASSLPTRKR